MGEVNKKELAEWGAEWLGKNPTDGNQFSIEWALFQQPEIASYFAHFAKRKMEEMGFRLEYRNEKIENRYLHFYLVKVGDNPARMFSNKNENEYIALFLAIREAVNGNKD